MMFSVFFAKVMSWIGFAVCVGGGLVLMFRLFSGVISLIAVRRLAKIRDVAGRVLDDRFNRKITEEEFRQIATKYMKQRKGELDAKKTEVAEKDGED